MRPYFTMRHQTCHNCLNTSTKISHYPEIHQKLPHANLQASGDIYGYILYAKQNPPYRTVGG